MKIEKQRPNLKRKILRKGKEKSRQMEKEFCEEKNSLSGGLGACGAPTKKES